MDFLEKIDKRIAKLQMLREMYIQEMGDDSTEAEEAGATPRIGDTGVINLDDLGLPTKPAPRTSTLKKNAIAVIKRFDKKNFTVNHAFVALDKMGKVTTNKKNYKNRLSAVIRKLAENGELERTHKGSGNDPHQYREVEINED